MNLIIQSIKSGLFLKFHILFSFLLLSYSVLLRLTTKTRKSRSQMFFTIGVSKSFRKFHRETPFLESLFNKPACLLACKFIKTIKTRLNTSVFLSNLRNFWEYLFLQKTWVDYFCKTHSHFLPELTST